MKAKRVFIMVLDSVGAGEAPDAAQFGDVGAHTLRSVWKSGALNIPTLSGLGLGHVDGLSFLGRETLPLASTARLTERSAGKDTTVGHWELAGHISTHPLPTFPNGFPSELIAAVEEKTGRRVICNRPYSGTQVLVDFGEEHLRTGSLIVYTSADSVFQIAAHEDMIPTEDLYAICHTVRELLTGDRWGVGRVIARPFAGEVGHFYRTDGRRDFSLKPPKGLLPERVKQAGLTSVSIGKISDIFADVGFTHTNLTHSNQEGMALTEAWMQKEFCGLCFTNLVDFDMKWGHRRDVKGYAEGLNALDAWLSRALPLLGEEDLLIITADHGCDPAFAKTTDHTREYVPCLLYQKGMPPIALGTQNGFDFVARTVLQALGLDA